VVACTGNATYTATYKATYIDYTVTFLNEDGTVVATVTYHYGDQIVGPADPTKASDNTYTYAFAGWDGALGTCTGNATYTATYSKTYIEYTVQFVDEDGTVISTATYHWGDSVAAPSDPTKSADKTYTYAFTGWDRSVVACSGNATYTATYSKTYIEYTVQFVDEDGTVISTATYHYGDTVAAPSDPTKSADKTYTYSFSGWDSAVVACTGNATYTATYKATYIDYTVTFLNEDGTVVATVTYHYGDQIVGPADPTKASDNTYTYAFAGWDGALGTCTGNATYTATYSKTYIEYTVQFVDEDGTVISTATYHWGDSVAAPSDPTKASDSMYDYTFAGWTPEVATCSGDATYKATYSKTYTQEYSSGLLRDQLLGDISKITTIDLSTYDKIAAIEAQLGQLTAADKATVENALAPIIAGYNAFVAGINSEYQESVSITNDWLLRTGYEVTHNLLSPELIRKRKAC
jgi:antitoxin component YwqK of YwqJK toxin-antitoxin module